MAFSLRAAFFRVARNFADVDSGRLREADALAWTRRPLADGSVGCSLVFTRNRASHRGTRTCTPSRDYE
ncbi:hypothetical protein [Lysobacter enzymogenes]|uniref:hypothetical protein n=1 Tax=Lysobacter enzymogenes TaxID=69 RepID=UPI0019D1EA91|nr:hypothetical protein [Lysobacter enzymogenes]